MKTDLIYLATPYSHPDPGVREWRFRKACVAAAFLMQRGNLIFCPIAHTHHIASIGDLPLGWNFWESQDRAMLNACSRMLVVKMDGWQESCGIAAEIKYMNESRKQVEYLEPWQVGLGDYEKHCGPDAMKGDIASVGFICEAATPETPAARAERAAGAGPSPAAPPSRPALSLRRSTESR